jgi:hypothetical protein
MVIARRWIIAAALSALVTGAVGATARPAAARAATVDAITDAAATSLTDVTGRWRFSVVTENGTGTPLVRLKQEGEKLTGTYESNMLGTRDLEGSIKGDSLRFVLKGGEVALTFIGVVVDKDHLKGTVDFAGMGGASFTAVREEQQ